MPTIQLQIAITITEEVANNLAGVIAPAIKETLEPKPSDNEVRREARIKASRNAIFAGQKPPEDHGHNDGRMSSSIKIGLAL